MNLLLAAVLAAQGFGRMPPREAAPPADGAAAAPFVGPPAPEPRPLPPVGDLVFMRVVEEFVLGATPGAKCPEPYAALFARLGSSSWRERDAASYATEAAVRSDPSGARWLMAGRRHPDPEVRLRCNAILRRLNPCRTCDGGGISKNWEYWACWDCGGAGTSWPLSAWD